MTEVKEKNAAQTAVSTKKERNVRRKNAEKRIYVGPTILGVAAKNTIFSGELPGSLKEAIKKNPYLSNLVVSVGQYPAAEKMLRNKKGYVYDAYQEAAGGNAK